MKNAHSGFILPFTLILLTCVGIAVTGTMSYVASAGRQSAAYAAKSGCRLAALSAIDRVRGDVYNAFLSRTGNKALLNKSASLNWFTTASSGSSSLGNVDFSESSDIVRDLKKNFPGHNFKIRIASTPEIVGTHAFVTFLATARRTDGRASSTMAERISFGIDRSRVFDHAYFVNNYGWFNGSETQIIANGDVRANGDMSLSGGPKINGNVYAARNDELRVPGQIKDGIGTMDSKSAYKSKQYGVNDRARPLQEKAGDGGYDAPATVTTQSKNDRLHPEPNQTYGSGESQQLEMPWISDLNQYVDYGSSADYGIYSTLSQGDTYYVDNRPSNRGGENYGYYTGTGPSGDPKMPDNHALVLEGTQANPIKLNGPVVVSNDVVIKGYVTGQGTIYSQRNIHIVGDIQYVNPPTWAGKAGNANNTTKDLLCLAAKGNIVLGDPTQSSWLSSTLKNCISSQPYVQQYECAKNDDGSWGDADIGYPLAGKSKFGGSYTVADGGAKVKETKTEKFHYETQTDRYGRKTQKKVSDGYEYAYSKDTTRKYYDSVVPPSALHDIASTITRIDAVLYNNHGIFGNVGACTVNGSLVCRNEGIIFSGSLYLNWDYRLYSGSPESVANQMLGAPVEASVPEVQILQEVPDSWNGIGGAEDD